MKRKLAVLTLDYADSQEQVKESNIVRLAVYDLPEPSVTRMATEKPPVCLKELHEQLNKGQILGMTTFEDSRGVSEIMEEIKKKYGGNTSNTSSTSRTSRGVLGVWACSFNLKYADKIVSEYFLKR